MGSGRKPPVPINPNLGPANETRRQNKHLAAMMRRLIANSGQVQWGENFLWINATTPVSDEEQAVIVTIIEESE